MSIKSVVKLLYLKKLKKMSDSDILINKLRRIGSQVGDNCFIFSKGVETAEPYLVSIGNNVTISNNVSFNTHDDSVEVYYKRDTLIVGRISIGNNCFIGAGCIILPGVTIADNCIIGAGSVVTKSVSEKGSVIAGVPARVVGNIDSLYRKNKDIIIDTKGKNFQDRRDYILKHPEKMKRT